MSADFWAGAGEYVLIHRKDWDQFKFDLRMAFGPTTPDVVGCTNADQPDERVYCKWCNTMSRPGEKHCPVCGVAPASDKSDARDG